MSAIPALAAASPFSSAVIAGNQAALGRALSLIEAGGARGAELLGELAPHAGRAKLIGITGSPGAGKSTVVDSLIRIWRARGKRVAVLAVDPVSPKSGGAVLGDRTRMGEHSLDEGVFIRSVSARGHLGGLCAAARGMAMAMDAAGWEIVILETVGAGQSETEISNVVDLTLVIATPGMGDELQAIKAGILEIADILVVNKSDLPDADRAARDLAAMVQLREGEATKVPVVQVSAKTGSGLEELCDSIDARMAAEVSVSKVGMEVTEDAQAAARRHAKIEQLIANIGQNEELLDWLLSMVRSRV